MQTYSLEEMTDEHIGKVGTPKRDAFESKLKLDLLGYTIKIYFPPKSQKKVTRKSRK